MPIISIRDLTRDSRAVFEALEANPDGPPHIITRNGKPIAVLVPIDESQVETLLLSAAPGLVRQRDAAAHATAEGRTTSLEDFLAEDGAAAQVARTQVSVPAFDAGGAVHERAAGPLTTFIGDRLAGHVAATVHERAVDITTQVMAGAGVAGVGTEAAEPIRQMNEQLIMLKVQQEILGTIGTRLTAIGSGHVGNPVVALEEVTGPAQTQSVIDAVTEKVSALNGEFAKYAGADAANFVPLLEAQLRGSLETLASQADTGLGASG